MAFVFTLMLKSFIIIFLRIISVPWILGSIYWIYIEPTNTEPKINIISSLFSIVSFFSTLPRGAEVFITIHHEGHPTDKHKVMLHLENKGDQDAKDLQIIFPPSFQTYEGDLASIPKVLRVGELKKIRVIRGLGFPHQYDVKWS